jgi:hypothetical protein
MLCHNCDDTRIEYTGTGSIYRYSFSFEYNERGDIRVATKNLDGRYTVVDNDEWSFDNDTTIRFNKPPEKGQVFIIYRCTDITPMPAEFFPGNSVKAEDLNDNFFVLQSAIEENRCSISKVSNEVDMRITQAEQEAGEWVDFNDGRIASSDAIRARHDAHVTHEVPPSIVYEQPGKGWENTDKCWSSYWNSQADAWVAYVNTGPRGEQGVQGPPGQSIIGPPGPEGPNGGTFPDAPADGETYGRKDAAWEIVESFSGDYNDLTNKPPIVSPDTNYKGIWTDPNTTPADPQNADFWIWGGGTEITLSSVDWGDATNEIINDGDRLFYDGTTFDVIPNVTNMEGYLLSNLSILQPLN